MENFGFSVPQQPRSSGIASAIGRFTRGRWEAIKVNPS
jgi:hypothetical protein